MTTATSWSGESTRRRRRGAREMSDERRAVHHAAGVSAAPGWNDGATMMLPLLTGRHNAVVLKAGRITSKESSQPRGCRSSAPLQQCSASSTVSDHSANSQ
jgi:hypothetical protein